MVYKELYKSLNQDMIVMQLVHNVVVCYGAVANVVLIFVWLDWEIVTEVFHPANENELDSTKDEQIADRDQAKTH